MLIRYSAGLIIAGWDERHGGQVYSIPLGGSLHKQSYAIGGSGSTYIYGYCDANWKEGMDEEAAVNFVKGALQEAIKWRLYLLHAFFCAVSFVVGKWYTSPCGLCTRVLTRNSLVHLS